MIVPSRGRACENRACAAGRGLLTKFGGRGGVRRHLGIYNLAAGAHGVRGVWANSPSMATGPKKETRNLLSDVYPTYLLTSAYVLHPGGR